MEAKNRFVFAVILFFFVLGALVFTNIVHEMVHYIDYLKVEGEPRSLCFLNIDFKGGKIDFDGRAAYYWHTIRNMTKQEADDFAILSEKKAYTVDIIVSIVVLILLIYCVGKVHSLMKKDERLFMRW